MNSVSNSIRSFATDDAGGQIIEYALIVAVVALGLLLALRPLADSGYFSGFLTRLGNCFSATCT